MKRFLNALLGLSILMVFASGCSSGPKRDKGTVLSYLNGESYKKSIVVPGVPVPVVYENQGKSSVIRGSVVVGDNLLSGSLRNQWVVLLNDEKKEVLKARTDSNGKFELKGDIPSGSYRLKIDSKCFRGETGIELNQYETEGLIIRAEKSSSCAG